MTLDPKESRVLHDASSHVHDGGGEPALEAAQQPQSAADTDTSVATCHPLVGIGASAGGLEALQKIFDVMPHETGMCFVVVQHLDPTQQSQLAQILTRHTTMPVVQIEDGMKIQPDHVYVILADWYVVVEKGVLRLRKPDEPRALRKPIDFFFRSIAEDQQERAICIVLSGTGTNGTLGLADVKAHGLADYVLPVEEMPKVLLQYAAHPYVQDAVAREKLPETDLQAFNEILRMLHRRRGHDFQPYKRPTLRPDSDPRAPALFLMVNGSYEKPAVWVFDPYDGGENVWRTAVEAESDVNKIIKVVQDRVAAASRSWLNGNNRGHKDGHKDGHANGDVASHKDGHPKRRAGRKPQPDATS